MMAAVSIIAYWEAIIALCFALEWISRSAPDCGARLLSWIHRSVGRVVGFFSSANVLCRMCAGVSSQLPSKVLAKLTALVYP
jgi:hypothetical protein